MDLKIALTSMAALPLSKDEKPAKIRQPSLLRGAGRLMCLRIGPIACFAFYVAALVLAVMMPLNKWTDERRASASSSECMNHYANTTAVAHDIINGNSSMTIIDRQCIGSEYAGLSSGLMSTDGTPATWLSRLNAARILERNGKNNRTIALVMIDGLGANIMHINTDQSWLKLYRDLNGTKTLLFSNSTNVVDSVYANLSSTSVDRARMSQFLVNKGERLPRLLRLKHKPHDCAHSEEHGR